MVASEAWSLSGELILYEVTNHCNVLLVRGHVVWVIDLGCCEHPVAWGTVHFRPVGLEHAIKPVTT